MLNEQPADPLLPCQALFGLQRGGQIIAAVEEDTGDLCPCKQGRTCPLLGELVPVVPDEDADLMLDALGGMSVAQLEAFAESRQGVVQRFASARAVAKRSRNCRVS